VVALSAGASGLPGKSSALCHQITTLDRAKLTEKIGALSADSMAMVEQALFAAVDIRKQM
jgi:mRNA-degrading endonuclease toxin of MazEF toxin-antitoxin module